jgi:hypothetical protein
MTRRSAHSSDPTGKRALFEAPVQAPPETRLGGPAREGRDALFSSDRRTPATVVVECEHCAARTRVGLADLGVRLLTGSAWLPFRGERPHWMRCPSCRRRAWCRIGWNE